MRVPDKYLYGVTWNGLNSDSEYVDARAKMAYADYLPQNDVRAAGKDEKLSVYLDRYLADFVTGRSDISDDDVWNEYVSGAEGLIH